MIHGNGRNSNIEIRNRSEKFKKKKRESAAFGFANAARLCAERAVRSSIFGIVIVRRSTLNSSRYCVHTLRGPVMDHTEVS